jgi:hypothetical protein
MSSIDIVRIPAEAPQLVAEFLSVTARMPEGRAAGLAGVSIPTLQRWIRQSPRILRPPVRERITRFLADPAEHA